MKARQRNPREALLLALHVEIVRNTHELYELRDLCETHVKPPVIPETSANAQSKASEGM